MWAGSQRRKCAPASAKAAAAATVELPAWPSPGVGGACVTGSSTATLGTGASSSLAVTTQVGGETESSHTSSSLHTASAQVWGEVDEKIKLTDNLTFAGSGRPRLCCWYLLSTVAKNNTALAVALARTGLLTGLVRWGELNCGVLLASQDQYAEKVKTVGILFSSMDKQQT